LCAVGRYLLEDWRERRILVEGEGGGLGR
jgi:hypothetical protein